MRSLSLSGLFILVCYLSQAQSNTFPSSGNVGIGTNNPLKTLEVRSPVNNYISIGATFSSGNYSGIHFGYLENDNILYRKSALVFERTDDAARGKIHLLNNAGYNNSSATLSDSKLTINYDGNVGIGTTAPDSKLTVKGVIHAEEVKVDLAVPGPDYVFDESYPLRSLEDTKTYIDQNKHLPGIPSSDEMQTNGVNLLDMNMKLLEKVEELTLHLIRIEKELQELKQGQTPNKNETTND